VAPPEIGAVSISGPVEDSTVQGRPAASGVLAAGRPGPCTKAGACAGRRRPALPWNVLAAWPT